MGYWGWRPLLAVFVSVWVVGCSATQDSAPTIPPTTLPRVTLVLRTAITPTPQSIALIPNLPTQPVQTLPPIIHTVQPGETLLNLAHQYGVPLATLEAANGGLDPLSLQIGQVITIPNPQFNAAGIPVLPTATPLSLALAPPVCYETPTNRVLCVGRVVNASDQPLERVLVRVQLWGKHGERLAEGLAGVEQRLILPGDFAPYRILFAVNWDAITGASAMLGSADHAEQVEQRFAIPTLEDETGQWVEGRFQLIATLRNQTAQAMQLQRAVISLVNRNGEITGYRVVPMNVSVPTGTAIPLAFEVLPHVADTAVTHHLYIEAVPGS